MSPMLQPIGSSDAKSGQENWPIIDVIGSSDAKLGGGQGLTRS